MPIYEYIHTERDECADFECFQKMKDDTLEVCPVCRQPVQRKISSPNFAMKSKAPSADKLSRMDYELPRGEQAYVVPSSGEKIITTGMTKREKQVAVWQGHKRAGDSAVTDTGPESVEILE